MPGVQILQTTSDRRLTDLPLYRRGRARWQKHWHHKKGICLLKLTRNIVKTLKGIGPSYSTKATRSGVRISEIFNEKLFNEKLRELARGFKQRYGDLLQYDVEDEVSRFSVSSPISSGNENITHLPFFTSYIGNSWLLMSLMPSFSCNPLNNPPHLSSSKARTPSCSTSTTAHIHMLPVVIQGGLFEQQNFHLPGCSSAVASEPCLESKYCQNCSKKVIC
jgi:hypothetical protein